MSWSDGTWCCVTDRLDVSSCDERHQHHSPTNARRTYELGHVCGDVSLSFGKLGQRLSCKAKVREGERARVCTSCCVCVCV
jgi:hypothetical protein